MAHRRLRSQLAPVPAPAAAEALLMRLHRRQLLGKQALAQRQAHLRAAEVAAEACRGSSALVQPLAARLAVLREARRWHRLVQQLHQQRLQVVQLAWRAADRSFRRRSQLAPPSLRRLCRRAPACPAAAPQILTLHWLQQLGCLQLAARPQQRQPPHHRQSSRFGSASSEATLAALLPRQQLHPRRRRLQLVVPALLSVLPLVLSQELAKRVLVPVVAVGESVANHGAVRPRSQMAHHCRAAAAQRVLQPQQHLLRTLARSSCLFSLYLTRKASESVSRRCLPVSKPLSLQLQALGKRAAVRVEARW